MDRQERKRKQNGETTDDEYVKMMENRSLREAVFGIVEVEEVLKRGKEDFEWYERMVEESESERRSLERQNEELGLSIE